MDYIQPSWPAPAHIKAYTTLRTGWGGRQPYHDTRHGFYTSNADESTRLKTLLNLPDEPIWLKQEHTTIAIEATPTRRETVADASFTHETNRVCAILTADCIPILMCNRQGTQVAAIHAGWRGLANGIIEKTIDQLQPPHKEWMAWLGPAISQPRYEVGSDVFMTFIEQHPQYAAAFLPTHPGKWIADLYMLAKFRLMSRSILRVYGGDYCTYTQEDMFFSYRRDQGKTGRMASVIWIGEA